MGVHRLTRVEARRIAVRAQLLDAHRPTSMLEVERTLWEHNGRIRPMEDLSLHAADMAVWPDRERTRAWLDANTSFINDVISRLDSRAEPP